MTPSSRRIPPQVHRDILDISDAPSDYQGAFGFTHWSQIDRIVHGAPDQAFAALSDFCKNYWQPLYYFARRWGKSEEAAMDSTQSFFLALLQKHYLDKADSQRGRLRTYLLSLFKHHLAHEHRDANRLKRGGSAVHLSLDHPHAPVYDPALAEHETPEDIYHRNWAMGLLETALTEVEKDWRKRGKAKIFNLLRPHLLEEAEHDLETTAKSLDTPPSTVRSWLHRLRLAYQTALTTAVAATLAEASAEAIRTELNELSRYFVS